MDNNKTVLGAVLILGGLFFLTGGLALGIILKGNETPAAAQADGGLVLDKQGLDEQVLDKQALLILQKQNEKSTFSPLPEPPPGASLPPTASVKAPSSNPKINPSEEAPSVPVPPKAVNGTDPKQINAAIDQGVKYLKKHQNLNGTWGIGAVPTVGYTALPGLTLLECGVSPKDPVVQKAAQFVRQHVSNFTGHFATYELSLATLFLDRLGDPADEKLIRHMALRLVAGQTAAGGWNYELPALKPAELERLFDFLEKTRPRNPLADPLAGAKRIGSGDPIAKGRDVKYLDPLIAGQDAARPGAQTLPRSMQAAPTGTAAPGDNAVKPADPVPPTPAPPKKPPKGGTLRPDFLPPSLQNIPAVVNHGKAKGKALLKAGRDDNSNSQFAMLALWAARRHGVPTDRTLLLAYQRYYSSQDERGGWGYMLTKPEQTPSMTCVGLLGLAMGHGSSPDVADPKRPKVAGSSTNEDPAIQKGLKALGSYIGTALPDKAKPPMENLYFLWSVERVAMLYDLTTIGGKEWYPWGAQILVLNQLADGCWRSDRYHGSAATIDTCFALLFLERSNLVQDLSDNLRLFMAITDPGAHK